MSIYQVQYILILGYIYIYIHSPAHRVHLKIQISNLQACALLLPQGQCVNDEGDVELRRYWEEGFGEIWSRSGRSYILIYLLPTSRAICSTRQYTKAQQKQYYCDVVVTQSCVKNYSVFGRKHFQVTAQYKGVDVDYERSSDNKSFVCFVSGFCCFIHSIAPL